MTSMQPLAELKESADDEPFTRTAVGGENEQTQPVLISDENSASTCSSAGNSKEPEKIRETSNTPTDDSSAAHVDSPSLTEEGISSNEPDDILDEEKLLRLLEANKQTASAVEGKSVLMPLGNTRAGKSTLVQFLSGTTFKKERFRGKTNYVIDEYGSDQLKSIAVSGKTGSMTSTIHAITLEEGEEGKAILDTPGFNDTRGIELDIANGFGIVQAVSRAKQVIPVLVLGYNDIDSMIHPVLDSVINMMEPDKLDPESWAYVYTRCSGEDPEDVFSRLEGFVEDLLGKTTIKNKETQKLILQHMVKDAQPLATTFIPTKNEEAPGLLDNLWRRKSIIRDPLATFKASVSDKSRKSLELHFANKCDLVEGACKAQDLGQLQSLLESMTRLEAGLSTLPQAKNALKKCYGIALNFLDRVRGEAETLVDLLVAIGNDMAVNNNSQMNKAKQLAASLQDKLVVLGDLAGMIGMPATRVGGKVALSHSRFLKETLASKLFKKGTAIDRLANSDGLDPSMVTGALRYASCIAGKLCGLSDNSWVQEKLTDATKQISVRLESELRSLAEGLAEPISVEKLADSSEALVSVLEMESFLREKLLPESNDTGIEILSLNHLSKNLSAGIELLLGRLERKYNRSMKFLVASKKSAKQSATNLSSLELDDLLSTLPADGLLDCRSYLLAIEFTPAVRSVVQDRSSINEGLDEELVASGLVKECDQAIVEYFVSLASLLRQHSLNAKQQAKDGGAESVEAWHDKTKKVRGIARTVETSCTQLRAVDNQMLLNVEKQLVGIQTLLDQLMEEVTTKAKNRKKRKAETNQKRKGNKKQRTARAKPKSFEQWVEELLEYKDFWGHTSVPKRYDEIPGLGRWVDNMRQGKVWFDKGEKTAQSGMLSDDRIRRLDEIGFDWGASESFKQWSRKVKELEAFRKEHGHVDVPNDDEHGNLFLWINCQKAQYKRFGRQKSTMTTARVQRLEQIGLSLDERSRGRGKKRRSS